MIDLPRICLKQVADIVSIIDKTLLDWDKEGCNAARLRVYAKETPFFVMLLRKHGFHVDYDLLKIELEEMKQALLERQRLTNILIERVFAASWKNWDELYNLLVTHASELSLYKLREDVRDDRQIYETADYATADWPQRSLEDMFGVTFTERHNND